LGLLSLARLARTGDERALAVVRAPNRGIFEVSFIVEIDTRINASWTVDVLRQFSARTVKENQIDLANKQQWIMNQLRCINDAARNILVATSTVTLPKGSRVRHEAKSTVKEKAAQVTNNPNLTAEGQNEKLAGKVQKNVGQIEKVLEK